MTPIKLWFAMIRAIATQQVVYSNTPDFISLKQRNQKKEPKKDPAKKPGQKP
ncbi:hypothetical protein [Pseudomonas syringae]|uniref:hypothetical protein n=1 Tax=Pseudomonas syringae TaxID=317 RepID=UPI0012AE64B1|nr:hypothetical protein [Pseudomonas syringae]